jgi:hypothetical protein
MASTAVINILVFVVLGDLLPLMIAVIAGNASAAIANCLLSDHLVFL